MKKLFLGLMMIFFFIIRGYCVEPVYTEQKIIDRIEILEDGQIQIRQATKIFKDGIEISKIYWRGVIAPDQDLTKIIIAPNATNEDINKVKAIANIVWTDEVKANYIAEKAKREKIIP